MKPEPNSKLDRRAFEKMKRILPNFLAAARHENDTAHDVMEMPGEIAFKLTNRCNLRCRHCYQWNENGHHRNLSKEEQQQDLDFAVIENVFLQTSRLKSNIYLWGGEPLLYDDWDKLTDLLTKDRRWTTLCTNGTGLRHKLDSILNISNRFEILFAFEGFEAEHDTTRGKGTFKRTIDEVDLLVKHKKDGSYLGEISINFVITDGMIGNIAKMVDFFETKGVDTIYISLPWYLSAETSAEMDDYFERHCQWLHKDAKHRQPSWHAYKYGLRADSADTLYEQIRVVNKKKRAIKIRYNPELTKDELKGFLSGDGKPAQNKARCLAVRNRMDIMPNGDVVSCKFFPEFSVGNLKETDVYNIWHGSRFKRIREILKKGLMPVCAKCNLLYSRGL